MKNLMVVLTIVSLSLSALAKQTLKVQVNGMVCSFCAQGIKKKFSKNESVDKVNVSLEEKRVTLEIKEGKNLTDEEINKIITESGYNVGKIERK